MPSNSCSLFELSSISISGSSFDDSMTGRTAGKESKSIHEPPKKDKYCKSNHFIRLFRIAYTVEEYAYVNFHWGKPAQLR